MFQDIARLSKQTLTYGAATVLTRLVAFILVPFFTHYLSPAQFGVQQLFYITIAVGTEMLLLGLDVSLLRYYTLEKDAARRKVIFSTVWIAGFVFSTALAIVVWFAAPWLVRLVVELPTPTPDWAIYTLRLCAGILWLEILNAFPFMVLRGDGQSFRFTSAKISGAVLQTAFTLVALVWMKRGVVGVFEANLLSSLCIAGMLLPAVISRLSLIFDRAMFKACLAFGLPNVPNSFFVIAVDLADRKILELLSGQAVTGLYSVGYRLGTFLAIVVAGFRFAWQPFFLSISHREDAKVVYGRVLTYYIAVMVWFYLMLTAFVEPLAKWNIPGIGILIAPEFWGGLKVFPVVLLAHLFNGAYAIFMVGVYLEKKTRALPIITGIAAIINVGGNFLLIPKYGMWAAAWLTVASYAVMATLLYFYIQRYYPIAFEWGRVFKIMAVGGLVFWVGYTLKENFTVPIPGMLLSLIFPLFLLIPGILSDGERRTITSMIRR